MFWPVMFEAASNVGPEGPLKKMGSRLCRIRRFPRKRGGEDDPDSEESDFE